MLGISTEPYFYTVNGRLQNRNIWCIHVSEHSFEGVPASLYNLRDISLIMGAGGLLNRWGGDHSILIPYFGGDHPIPGPIYGGINK